MQAVARRVVYEIDPIKGSRFITVASPVEDEATAQELLGEMRASYPDASHHCSAWRIMRPAIDRSSDDGEPSGSAGRPILAQLVGREITNTAVVVVRYFGGTKLGVGGLVRAYGKAAAETLDQCPLVTAQITTTIGCRLEYPDVSIVEQVISERGATVIDSTYSDHVTLQIRTAEDALDELRRALTDATAARISWIDADDRA